MAAPQRRDRRRRRRTGDALSGRRGSLWPESATNGLLIVSRGADRRPRHRQRRSCSARTSPKGRARARRLGRRGAQRPRADQRVHRRDTPVRGGRRGRHRGVRQRRPERRLGVMNYVVIAFGGTEISPDNGVNGLRAPGRRLGHRKLDPSRSAGTSTTASEFFGNGAGEAPRRPHRPGRRRHRLGPRLPRPDPVRAGRQGDDTGNNGTECDNNRPTTSRPRCQPGDLEPHVHQVAGIAEDNYAMLYRRGAAERRRTSRPSGSRQGASRSATRPRSTAFAAGDAWIDHTVLACTNPFEDSVEEKEDRLPRRTYSR